MRFVWPILLNSSYIILRDFRHKLASLNRVAANKSHCVLVAWESNQSRLFSKLKLLLSQNFIHYFYQILDLWISDNYLKRETYKINWCHLSPRAKKKQSQSQMICTGQNKKSDNCSIRESAVAKLNKVYINNKQYTLMKFGCKPISLSNWQKCKC